MELEVIYCKTKAFDCVGLLLISILLPFHLGSIPWPASTWVPFLLQRIIETFLSDERCQAEDRQECFGGHSQSKLQSIQMLSNQTGYRDYSSMVSASEIKETRGTTYMYN